jgi:hypothetical protein
MDPVELENGLWGLPLKERLRCGRCRTVLDFYGEVLRQCAEHGERPLGVTRERRRDRVKRMGEDNEYRCAACAEAL